MSRVLLFDLGGVLIDNVTFEELPLLLSAPMERAALQDRWLHSPAVQYYERGEIDADTFAADFVDEWALSSSPAQFLEAFATWPRGFFPGAVELLADLRKRHTIAFLSNCNAIHWERLAHVLDHADHAFSSHEVRAVKPEPAIFRHVAETLGCASEEITFFDDSATNARAAIAAGMRAYHTMGFDALRRTIESLRLSA